MKVTQQPLVSKVTSKFQITIPQTIREVMGISQGDAVTFEIEEGRIFIKKLQPTAFQD
jgi:antitoxin PrlF